MGNDLQKEGFGMFPVFLEEITLTGGFKYVLQSKHAITWDGHSEFELRHLVNAILQEGSSEEGSGQMISGPAGGGNSVPASVMMLRKGIRNFYNVNVDKYCDSRIDKDLIPRVVDYEQWLEELSALTLSESMKKLWDCREKSCLYIGKSGYGKTMGLFALMREILENYDDILPFFVSFAECDPQADHPVISSIYERYIHQFSIETTYYDLVSLFEKPAGNDKRPGIILLLDDISSCSEEAVRVLQNEIDWLRAKSNVQMLITSRTVQLPFSLGNIAVQRFDFQKLSLDQIEQYLLSQGISDHRSVPLGMLTNPLILTLYARTNDFVTKSRGDKACYVRESINSEADVLWNYLEMFAMKFYRDEKEPIGQLKYAFFFRFALPYVAFSMLRRRKTVVSLKYFSECVMQSLQLLQNEAFTDIFEEYFGYEDDIRFDKRECKRLFEKTLLNHTGFIRKTRAGRYEFARQELLHFFAAVFVFRMLIMHDHENRRPPELSEYTFSYETCRYIGELCEEHDNTPYRSENGELVVPNRKTLVTRTLDKYRRVYGNEGMRGVSNLMQILKTARDKDLAGASGISEDGASSACRSTVIGAPFTNSWAAMDIKGKRIAMLSTEGSLVLYDCETGKFRILIRREFDSTVPFICAWNASFVHLDKRSSMDEGVRDTLRAQNCVFDEQWRSNGGKGI